MLYLCILCCGLCLVRVFGQALDPTHTDHLDTYLMDRLLGIEQRVANMNTKIYSLSRNNPNQDSGEFRQLKGQTENQKVEIEKMNLLIAEQTLKLSNFIAKEWDLGIKISEQNQRIHKQNIKILENEILVEKQNIVLEELGKTFAIRILGINSNITQEVSEKCTNLFTRFPQRFTSDNMTQEINKVVMNLIEFVLKQNVFYPGEMSEYFTEEISHLVANLSLNILPPNVIEQLKNSSTKAAGASFIRWGRKDCPFGISQLLYSGTVGGSFYNHKGGATEYLCMPPDPQWNTNKTTKSTFVGYLYGGEYQEYPDMSLFQDDVPCAVCVSPGFAMSMMIPGRIGCYEGWQKAYYGDLASGRHDHDAGTEYVCLDRDHVGLNRKENEDGVLFYPVIAKCGTLPCPPYKHNTPVACVVCIK